MLYVLCLGKGWSFYLNLLLPFNVLVNGLFSHGAKSKLFFKKLSRPSVRIPFSLTSYSNQSSTVQIPMHHGMALLLHLVMGQSSLGFQFSPLRKHSLPQIMAYHTCIFIPSQSFPLYSSLSESF